jgi:hypothetical protein
MVAMLVSENAIFAEHFFYEAVCEIQPVVAILLTVAHLHNASPPMPDQANRTQQRAL